MANIFQRIGGAIGRVFGREEALAEPQPQAEPEERRGFFTRIRDRVTGEDRRREEREHQAEQERQARVRIEQERAVLEQQRQEIARERQELERQRQEIERARQARDRAELEQQTRQRQERLPDALRGIPPVLPLGPKGKEGAAYTTISSGDVMSRLQDAAQLGKRVSLRVHDSKGWHDLFLNDQAGPGRHKPGRGISADYLAEQIGGDFDQWIEDGGAVGEEGDTSPDGDEGFEDIDGYQLTVWS